MKSRKAQIQAKCHQIPTIRFEDQRGVGGRIWIVDFRLTIDYCISPQRTPHYDLPDLPPYHFPKLRGRRGPDSGISASLQQAKHAEKDFII